MEKWELEELAELLVKFITEYAGEQAASAIDDLLGKRCDSIGKQR